MDKSGKNLFGKGFNFNAEVTNGECPLCDAETVFVSLYENIYRCISCGADTEQKINGVISFMPIASGMVGPKPTIKLFQEE